ncbi:MAG: hypothetical protein ACREMY_09080, partial [bacterium]
MRSILKTLWQTGIVANLITGSLILLPLVLTVLIIGWIVGAVAAIIGPGTWFGELLTTGGEAFVGPKREVIAFLLGGIIALTGIWLLG